MASEAFWALAADHGVAALVARQLGAPPPFVRALVIQQAAHALLCRAVLAEVIELLGRASMPSVPLKGPLLSMRLYGEYSLRPTTDVDVLVARADLDRALEVLIAAGAHPPDAASRRYHQAHHHHVNVVLRGALVEIHFRVSSNFGAVIPSEPLMARISSGVVDGAMVPVLDPTDEMVCLAVNAAAHRFRGVLLLDLRRLAEQASVDWGEAERRAREWHVARATAAALVAASQRAGLLIDGMSPAWRAQGRRALQLLPALPLSGEPRVLHQARDVVTQSSLADSPVRAARTALHHAMRVLRRRAQRTWPAVVPSDWAG